MGPQIHGQISPLFSIWFADINEGIPGKDRNQYIAEQISCDIIIQNPICIPGQKSADRFCPWLSENVYIWKKTEKRNYNTRSKTFNVIFCVVRSNNDVHFISLSSFSSIRTIFG